MDEDFGGLTEREKLNALSKFFLTRITGPDRPHPLAYSQESRWALTMSTAQAAVENHTFVWRLDSALDPEALRLAVEALLERYPCLRSVFGVYEGRTVRFVKQNFAAPFQTYDRTSATQAEISSEITREAYQPFDLRSDPALRVRLFQTAPNQQALLLTAHHILADFSSLVIALRTLAELYLRKVASLPVEPPGHVADYDAFVLWEAKRVLGTPGRDALTYWGRQFADGLDFVELPTDRTWPSTRGFQDSEFRFTIGDRSIDRLKRMGQEHDCTLFVVMLALFKVLIHTYTGQRTIAVISPVSTRSHLSFENQVGALSNHLLLRSHLDGNQSFIGFLKQVRQCVIDAMEHRDFPISLVTKRVRVRGIPRGAVPFPLKFNMPKAHDLNGQLADTPGQPSRLKLTLEAFNAEFEILDRRVTGNSELNLAIFEVSGGLLGSIQYNVELFDAATIRHMVSRLSHLGEVIGENSHVTLHDLARVCSTVGA